MKTKTVSAKQTFRIVKAIYFLIGVGITVPLAIILTTDGSLKHLLLDNWIYLLLPLSIPAFYSYVGLQHFFFTDDEYVVSIQSKCVAIGEYISSYNTRLEMPRNHLVSYHEHHHMFGIKKEMCVIFLINGDKKRQKFNISMLSKRAKYTP
ncbi:MAG: hypothetical protein H8E12_01755 [Rhodobacteraceae bacterium]|nr:hypothetical protein [Paracoccaceae bacterium]